MATNSNSMQTKQPSFKSDKRKKHIHEVDDYDKANEIVKEHEKLSQFKHIVISKNKPEYNSENYEIEWK